MASHIVLLLVSLAVILAGAEVFTNSVEWLGKKLNLGAGAVGSVFAAVGTALPETLIPVVAILGGGAGSAGHDIGIGAILGAPFMLATLAMFVTGLAGLIVHKNNYRMDCIEAVMKRDMRFFMLVYTVAIVASFLPRPLKLAASGFLVGAYIFYVYSTIKSSRAESDDEHDLKPLYLKRKSDNPSLGFVLLQVFLALGIIITGAYLFVGEVQVVATVLGTPVLVLSLIITPIATELPEKFNSIIWVSQGKDTLALGNITGAMVFQSSLIPTLGILLTSWELEPLALFSAVLALGAVLYQYTGLAGRHGLRPSHLMAGGLFYLVFLIVALTGLL